VKGEQLFGTNSCTWPGGPAWTIVINRSALSDGPPVSPFPRRSGRFEPWLLPAAMINTLPGGGQQSTDFFIIVLACPSALFTWQSFDILTVLRFNRKDFAWKVARECIIYSTVFRKITVLMKFNIISGNWNDILKGFEEIVLDWERNSPEF